VYNTLMQDEQPGQSEPAANWEFNPHDSSSYAPGANVDNISWTASEFIAHDKDMTWFAALGAVTALLVALTFLLTRDFVSTGIVLVVIICFGAFAVRKPRILPYRLDHVGLHVDQKTYHYDQLKSFSLIQEGGVRSIQLMPLKRFMPPISIYMDPSDEDKIIDVLANYLPMEQRQQDMIDQLMRRLRF
jgi:hypothetical protein